MSEIKTNDESTELPASVLEYLQTKHSTVIIEYRTPDGRFSEHCGMIALEIAKILITAGRKPHIALVSEDVHEGGFVKTKDLVPKAFGNKVTWGAHWVCVCDGYALDPILGVPVLIEHYTQSVFGESIKTVNLLTYEKILEFIRVQDDDGIMHE